MRIQEVRLDMRLISPEVLRLYMDDRKLSMAALARRVTLAGVKTSKSMIGHLASGERKITSAERAVAISEVLGVPRKALFADSASTVSRDVGPKRRRPAA